MNSLNLHLLSLKTGWGEMTSCELRNLARSSGRVQLRHAWWSLEHTDSNLRSRARVWHTVPYTTSAFSPHKCLARHTLSPSLKRRTLNQRGYVTCPGHLARRCGTSVLMQTAEHAHFFLCVSLCLIIQCWPLLLISPSCSLNPSF